MRLKVLIAGTLVVLGAGLFEIPASAHAALGDLDVSFSEDGRQLTDFGGGECGFAVAIQRDGRIVVAGGRDGDVALARYNPDGSLDTSFSVDGTQTTDVGGSDGAGGVAIGPDGKIVAAGWSDSDLAVVRYNPDGSLDSTFAGDGTQTTDLGGSDGARGVVIQPDGRIAAAGWSNSDFALVRYNPDGSLDGSFAGDGTQTTAIGDSSGAAGLAIQGDGKLVAVGRSGTDFALTRYATDGSLDATFSGDGKQSADFGGDDDGTAVALQADGRIVAAGTSIRPDSGGYNVSGDFALASYTPDGALAGTQLTVFLGDVEFGAHARAEGVAIQADGKPVAVGWAAAPSFSSDFALARYDGGPSAPEPGTPPTNVTAPTISGSATDGQTLTASAGAWSGSTPITLSDMWRRCDSAGANCVAIAAATATTYSLTTADVGHTIRVRETATNAYGSSAVDSTATAVVNATAGAISGTVRSASTGFPITGAGVDCGPGHSAKTASDGTYSLPNMTAGKYRCTASAQGYAASTQTVTVTLGQTTTASFSLRRR